MDRQKNGYAAGFEALHRLNMISLCQNAKQDAVTDEHPKDQCQRASRNRTPLITLVRLRSSDEQLFEFLGYGFGREVIGD